MKSQITKTLLSLFLLVLCSHIVPGQKPVSSVEYTIYGAVLRALDRDYLKQSPGETQHYLLLTDLFDPHDLTRARSGRTLIARKLTSKLKHSFVDLEEIKALIDKGTAEYKKEKEARLERARSQSRPLPFDMCGESAWKYFFARYPGSAGYYQFSEIRFGRNRGRAYVDVKGTGSAWGTLTSFMLTKTRNGWIGNAYGGSGGVC